MADKDKNKPQIVKNMPKDGQVIMAIMKEMGITEYEPKTIVQLTEFVYRYGSSILEEAKTFANPKQKFLSVEDVTLALQLQSESTFTMPPPREVLLECARYRNNVPLPVIKPPCGLRLPPDRHCLSSPNYILKGVQKKPSVKGTFTANKPTVNIIKRTSNFGINKQTVTIPKPVTKVTSNPNLAPQKTVLKTKIQIGQAQGQGNNNGSNGSPSILGDTLKRKREDGDE